MSMILDLSRLRGGVETVDRRFEASAINVAAEDFRVVSPVELKAEATKDGQKIRLVGRLTAALEMDCSRCLEPFAVPVDNAFDLLFLPATAVVARDGEAQLADDDVGVSFFHDDQIDLADVVREQFYLAVPMKPLCREDCLGLCPVCGSNRNREPCSCQSVWVDPRLEPLRKVRIPES
ncbi:MAG: DUF177 domain-containing protein [Vicinamibacterales bacterium]